MQPARRGRIIPAMTRTVHIIDAAATRDCLRSIGALAGPDDLVVSVGPAPRWLPPGLNPTAVHRPMGLATLCGHRIAGLIGDVQFVLAWSEAAATAGEVVAAARSAPLLRTLASLPTGRKLSAMLNRLRPGRLVVSVPTEAARRELVRLGAAERSVVVLRPPAPLAEMSATRQQTRERLGLGQAEALLVAPAEMTRDSGHKYAAWIHGLLRHGGLEVKLLLPGGGPHEKHVRSFAATTGFDEELFFTGERFTLGEVLAAGDVAIFPVERDCGVGALAAAMAAGAPIVATETPDIAECAPHEEAALLVGPGDPREAAAAILRLLEDRALADRLAATARQRAEELFDVEKCRVRLREIYASL